MRNQLDHLLLSIPIEADRECLGCKKEQQGHVCPEDQLHWTKMQNEHTKDQGKLGENCTVADPKSHVVEEEVGVSLNNILCNINAPLKDDLSGTSENV